MLLIAPQPVPVRGVVLVEQSKLVMHLVIHVTYRNHDTPIPAHVRIIMSKRFAGNTISGQRLACQTFSANVRVTPLTFNIIKIMLDWNRAKDIDFPLLPRTAWCIHSLSRQISNRNSCHSGGI